MIVDSFLNGRITVKVGDITEEVVDAIVNAANPSLFGGGGVDGAIHRAGGPQILRECRAIRESTHPDGLSTGEAVITAAGDLKARHVIHTVGPVYGMNHGRDHELLANAYLNSLHLAAQNAVRTIAFPSISTGVYGYPKNKAAEISSSAISQFLKATDVVAEVRLVFFSENDANVFLANQQIES
jgi:O-acetyl-ADP-ribose deacetylase (regulator of RNase III)